MQHKIRKIILKSQDIHHTKLIVEQGDLGLEAFDADLQLVVTGIHVNEPGNGGLELGVIRTALDLGTAGFHHTVRLLSQIERQATDTTARVHFVLKH